MTEFANMSDERQIDFNNATSKGKTPIYVAAKKGHVNVVKVLLKLNRNRVNFNKKSLKGDAPIHIAAATNQYKIIKLFVTLANEDRTRINFKQTTSDGLTIAHLAAQHGFDKIMRELIKLNPGHFNFNKTTKAGATCVWLAADKGFFKIIKVLGKLKKARVDFNQVNDEGITPVLVAVFKGHTQIIKALAKLRRDRVCFNQTSTEGCSPAYLAAEQGREEIMELFIQLGKERINLNLSFMGRTPLFVASDKGYLNIVKKLICLGSDRVDINLATPEGGTPIFIAAQKGHIDIFKELLLAGANYRAVFKSTIEDLKRWAREEHNQEIITRLDCFLENQKSNDVHMTPYDIAVITGHDKIAQLILEHEHTRYINKLRHFINDFQQQAKTIFFSAEEKEHALKLIRQLKRQLVIFSKDTREDPEKKLIIQRQFSHLIKEGQTTLTRYMNVLMKIKRLAEKIDLIAPAPKLDSGLTFFTPLHKAACTRGIEETFSLRRIDSHTSQYH